MDAKHLDKYRGRLFHRVPLVGGWLQRRAARALAADGYRVTLISQPHVVELSR